MLNFAMPFPIPRWPGTVDNMAAVQDASADEARLAERAIRGDANAFAELYGRYEKRAYNLCLRILGSEDEAADATQDAFVNVLRRLPKLEGRELAFGSYLFTSARHACYDLIEKRRRAEPTEEPPEPTGGEPGDPEDDPERNLLLEASQEEIRRANAELPERQREVLALRELEELSYDEIAEIMDMNRNSVAQLISRARINLRDALRGTALATVAASSEDCERALVLLAARQDLEAGVDADWLDLHLVDCDTCRLSRDAMEEAGLSYRSWAPVAAAPLLFRETMARAAETVGADWSDVGAGERPSLRRHIARDAVLIGALTLVLLFVALAAKTHDTAPVTDALPTAEDTTASAVKKVVRKKKHQAKKAHAAKKSAAPTLVADESGAPAVLPSEGSSGSGGAAPQGPSKRVRLDRGSEKTGGREQVDVVPTPAPEVPVPEPQPQPQPEPQPQPAPQPPPPPPCNPNRCPPPGGGG
jgi:RNA polymerase sigma-70 factor, ECF subfamily